LCKTYIYVTTQVDEEVGVGLSELGPSDLDEVKLLLSSVPSRQDDAKVAWISRTDNTGGSMYILDLNFKIFNYYIASLQILLRGHGTGSMIWWRWRAAREDVGYWITDHKSHSVRVDARGGTYEFRVTGKGTIGYDDILVELINNKI
jgi:hypothetical protein